MSCTLTLQQPEEELSSVTVDSLTDFYGAFPGKLVHAGVLAVFPPLHCLCFLASIRIYREACRGSCQFISFL